MSPLSLSFLFYFCIKNDYKEYSSTGKSRVENIYSPTNFIVDDETTPFPRESTVPLPRCLLVHQMTAS